MKNLLLLSFICLFVFNAEAQNGKRRKRKFDPDQTNSPVPEGFKVNGFARDVDSRTIKNAPVEDQLVVEKDEYNGKRKKHKMHKVKDQKVTSHSKMHRNRDIETLMNDMDLAKIQRPVFRGIMTESLRDENAAMNDDKLSAVEKNVALKEVYILRNKRLKETLNDDQWLKWNRIKDDDEYLEIPRPEDY